MYRRPIRNEKRRKRWGKSSVDGFRSIHVSVERTVPVTDEERAWVQYNVEERGWVGRILLELSGGGLNSF